jgi:hypothetical protein
MHNDTLRSWILLALALVAVLGALYVADFLQTAATARAEAAHTVAQQMDRQAFAERVGAIALDTEDERAELETFMRLDVVATAEEFERVGARSGAEVSVTDATPQGDGTELQWVSFTIAAEGTYASLIRALKLYESLPTALEIAQLDLEQLGETGRWIMTLRARVLAITTEI